VIDFSRSTFTWHNHPWTPDPYYRYAGGFVGEPGQVYHVRFGLEASCEIRDEVSGHVTKMFVGAPCRSEYTIASRNMFQIPSGEWRMAFSDESQLSIARRPSDEPEEASTRKLSEIYQSYKVDIRSHANFSELTDIGEVIDATLNGDLLNAQSTYHDKERNLTVSVEYPVDVMNLNVVDKEFQVCTGPIILPDLATWDGRDARRVFLAQVAISAFDWVEFILQREVEASEAEREWLDKPRGRDRLELHDPNNPPPNYPPARSRPTVYNEVWEFEATNVVLRAKNP
jgi:hypothetical protein